MPSSPDLNLFLTDLTEKESERGKLIEPIAPGIFMERIGGVAVSGFKDETTLRWLIVEAFFKGKNSTAFIESTKNETIKRWNKFRQAMSTAIEAQATTTP